MLKGFLLGVDIGTQGTKASLIALDKGIVSEAFTPSKLIRLPQNAVQEDPEDIYYSVLKTIKEAVLKAGIDPYRIHSIGIDGQMAGILGIDYNWNAITYYDSWLDTRCGKYIEEIKEKADEAVTSITGCPVTYAHGPKILWWKNEQPGVYKKIDKFIVPSCYVAGRLTGLKAENAFIDYTHLHFSGFADVEKQKWSEELLYAFNVDRGKMPQIVEPWKVIGKLTQNAANECGLISGTPVVAGCGDSAATSLGAGITESGLVFDVAGTASIFSCSVDKYKPDLKTKTLLYAKSVIPDLWTPMAYIGGGGMCLKWFKDNFTGDDGNISYSKLDNEAGRILPGSEGLVFLPYLSGRTCPNDPYIRGSWLGLNWAHGRGHMYRSIMESIAYEYKYYTNVLSELLGKINIKQVVAVGGGAKSSVFNSIKADVLGVKYSILSSRDTATLGSALIAGFGVNAFSNIKKAADSYAITIDTIEPNMDNHRLYKKHSESYEYFVKTLGSAYKHLETKH